MQSPAPCRLTPPIVSPHDLLTISARYTAAARTVQRPGIGIAMLVETSGGLRPSHFSPAGWEVKELRGPANVRDSLAIPPHLPRRNQRLFPPGKSSHRRAATGAEPTAPRPHDRLCGSKKMRMSALSVPRSCWARLRASRVEMLGLLGELRKILLSPTSRSQPACRVARMPEFLRT